MPHTSRILIPVLTALTACDSVSPLEPAKDALPDSSPSDTFVPSPILDLPWSMPSHPPASKTPEPPRILRDMALIDDDVEFTRPYVPGHRTTMDGRVALRVQGGPPGPPQLSQMLSFYLFVPEALDAPIMTGPKGANILTAPSYDIPFPPALSPTVTRLGHHTICDPTTPFPKTGERPNPYTCDEGDEPRDCYDLVIVSTTSETFSAQLWGTPVTVVVAAPKTPSARIVDVRMSAPIEGAIIHTANEWTEPAITRDGRLLTGRFGRLPREWTNPNTSETLTRPFDIAYSVLPDDMAPCDVRGWVDFHPMSHAPYDPEMIGRYGLAAQPFRDSEGALIPDGEDLGGTYPWVDREGNNVFMAAIPGRLVEQSPTRYPRRCVHSGCERYAENTDWDRGFLVGGLWTRGKFVFLDGMVSHLDWAIGVSPDAHYLVDLFAKPDGTPVPVRLGAGRFIDEIRTRGGPYPDGYTHNANILDSVQNLLNHDSVLRPVTPRDVVWVMSNGVATDEVAFDDYLDPNAFIVSNMSASVTQLYDADGASTGVPIHHNGQQRTLEGLPFPQLYILDPEVDTDIHLQNAATSTRWNVPSHGLIPAGLARVEPAALGGLHGRGLWLDGRASVRYDIPAQPRPIADTTWYIGLFVDARTDVERVLLTFPDGSRITLSEHTLRYVSNDRLWHEVTLPKTNGWRHLAWRLASGLQQVDLLLDGYPFDRFYAPSPLFALTPGDLVLGRPEGAPEGAGFIGWLDDFKVLAHDVNPEVACNHANGTLITAPENDPLAPLYPSWAHADIASAARLEPNTLSRCYLDFRDDYRAHLKNLPAGSTSLRDRINFPEGPLTYGAPRPDSSKNAFCLSCHHEDGRHGLSLDALAFRPELNAEDDPRRQPHQPPRRVFGHIPSNWLPGSPNAPTVAPTEGALIDRWILPPASR
jgi:hypothetical protein